MVFSGVGAGINELTALAVTSELAPTSKRGKYVAVLIFTIIPFCPSVLWGQLIASHSSWRWIGLFCGLWAFIGLVLTAVFYFPPPRVNSQGMSRREVLAQIDYVGGLLSISGMLYVSPRATCRGNDVSSTRSGKCLPLVVEIWSLRGMRRESKTSFDPFPFTSSSHADLFSLIYLVCS